jgi:hypothetical protein
MGYFPPRMNADDADWKKEKSAFLRVNPRWELIQNASIPVTLLPMISVWMSCVPS